VASEMLVRKAKMRDEKYALCIDDAP